ncbi:DUF2569 family protein [Comamonas composti]|uniref:DUF2569 family protein n=1 Tax=Comamonas composti TaxID=408558 RepID=UPI000A03631F|nr:DUF2569 family protein [Comamonas composti]
MSTWKKITADEAKNHALYGIRGWLALFAFTIVMVPVRSLSEIRQIANQAEIPFLSILMIDDPYAYILQWELVLSIGAASTIFYLMIRKAQNFRLTSIVIAFAYYPLLFIGILIFQVSDVLKEIMAPLIGGFFGTCIWAAYLLLSKRVRVTFEHKVRVIDGMDVTKKSTLNASPPPLNTTQTTKIKQSYVPQETVCETITDVEQKLDFEDEVLWEQALIEVDGEHRRAGLWAKYYAQCNGDESKAKANYLIARVREMQDLRIKAQQEQQQKISEKEENERIWENSSKGICPNCDNIILWGSIECNRCKAFFGDGAAWNLQPFTDVKNLPKNIQPPE